MNLDLQSSRTLLWPTAIAAIVLTALMLIGFAAVGAGGDEPLPEGVELEEGAHGEEGEEGALAPGDVPPGAVLVFRHALTDDGVDADPTARGSCDQQRNLSGDGVAQAERIGEALQALPIGAVYASPFCRTLDTADAFGVGEVIAADQLISTTAALDAAGIDAIIAAGLDLLADQVGGDDVAVAVTHTQNIEGMTGQLVDEGDAVVVVPPGEAGATVPGDATAIGVLGVIPADAW